MPVSDEFIKYYEVPPEVLEDRAKLADWAQRSFEIQIQRKVGGKTTPTRRGRQRRNGFSGHGP